MRARGDGGVFQIKGSRNWYIKIGGKRIATGTRIKAVAIRKLQERMGRLSLGMQTPEEMRRLRYEDIRDAFLAEYRHRGRIETTHGTKALDRFFSNRQVLQITPDLLREFIAMRKADGVSNGTINRNMGLLRRMLNLARKENRLQLIPHFPMLKERAPRDGFIEDAQFVDLLAALPRHLQPFVLFLYTTGCRTGEARKITWNQVILHEHVVRLKGTQTKNQAPRSLPLVDDLVKMLHAQEPKDGLVFPAVNFRRAWRTACVKAGLGTRVNGTYRGLIPHDLRRSAVRNLVRFGVSQTVAMSISGHKTISIFNRYDITDERDKHAAMNKIGSSLGQVLRSRKSLELVNNVE